MICWGISRTQVSPLSEEYFDEKMGSFIETHADSTLESIMRYAQAKSEYNKNKYEKILFSSIRVEFFGLVALPIILLLLLYLLAYLTRIKNVVSNSESITSDELRVISDVWVGTMTNWSARIFTVMTLGLLPTISVIVTLNLFFENIEYWSLLLALAPLSISIICLYIIRGIQKHRLSKIIK